MSTPLETTKKKEEAKETLWLSPSCSLSLLLSPSLFFYSPLLSLSLFSPSFLPLPYFISLSSLSLSVCVTLFLFTRGA